MEDVIRKLATAWQRLTDIARSARSDSPLSVPCCLSGFDAAERPWQRRERSRQLGRFWKVLRRGSQWYCVASNCPYRFPLSTWAMAQGLFTMDCLGLLHIIAMASLPEADGGGRRKSVGRSQMLHQGNESQNPNRAQSNPRGQMRAVLVEHNQCSHHFSRSLTCTYSWDLSL